MGLAGGFPVRFAWLQPGRLVLLPVWLGKARAVGDGVGVTCISGPLAEQAAAHKPTTQQTAQASHIRRVIAHQV